MNDRREELHNKILFFPSMLLILSAAFLLPNINMINKDSQEHAITCERPRNVWNW
jgi:hypothetical protein